MNNSPPDMTYLQTESHAESQTKASKVYNNNNTKIYNARIVTH